MVKPDHKRKMKIDNQYVSIGDAAKMMGVSVPTLRRWHRQGKFEIEFRTFGGHRRYSISSIREFLGLTLTKKTVGYARVSSHDQKKDLDTQKQFLINHGCDEVITDLGSGLNCRKRGLIKLLKGIIQRDFDKLVITHHDRLLRFGHELIFKLCEWFYIEVEIVNKKKEMSFELELTQDVITLMTVFSARLYGKRSHKNRKINKNTL